MSDQDNGSKIPEIVSEAIYVAYGFIKSAAPERNHEGDKLIIEILEKAIKELERDQK